LGIEKEYRELSFSDRKSKKKVGSWLFPTGNSKRKSENAKFRLSFSISERKLSTSDFLFQFPMRKREIPIFFFDSQREKANSRYSFSIPGRKKRTSGFLFDFPIGKRQILIENRKFRSEKAKFRFAFQERSLQSRPDVLLDFTDMIFAAGSIRFLRKHWKSTAIAVFPYPSPWFWA
jgi:hypothetical protein